MAESKRVERRQHSAELKAKVLVACGEPGASVAQVALKHGLNANLVHKWRRRAGGPNALAAVSPRSATFIPLTLSPRAAGAGGEIRIELKRGAVTMTLNWPLGAAGECAAWMRELLR